MESLPDVKALAEVPDDELMKLWEGLGYYNRARNLKAAAVQIMEEFDGEIPSDYSKLLSLRGIGSILQARLLQLHLVFQSLP